MAQVGTTARALGFAGLLPQIGFVGMALVTGDTGWRILAFTYGALILSFLGGIWWGFGVNRARGAQARLLALSVCPSLAVLVVAAAAMATLTLGWPLAALGTLIALTLFVDRSLIRAGDAPVGWMALRAPLSLGLGALTILGGAIG